MNQNKIYEIEEAALFDQNIKNQLDLENEQQP